MKLKTKRKAAASSQKYRGKQSYGIGGAVMTLGKNLLQGKKIGSGAFKGVLRAGITPGSGIGAGIGLAGALASKSKNPSLQKLGKGLGIAGNVAGMFTGGGGAGAGALGGLAGKFAGSGAGQAASKFAGNFAGLDKTLGGIGVASGGNPLMALVQNFIPGMSGANGMRVKSYEDGGKPKLKVKHLLEALEQDNPETMNKSIDFIQSDDKRGLNKFLNQEFRQDIKLQEQEGNEELAAERAKNRDIRKALNQEYREDLRVDDSGEEEIEGEGGIDKEQLKKILQALAAGGVGFGANGRVLPPYSGTHQFQPGIVREVPLAQNGREVPKRKGVRLNYDEEGNVIGESTHIMRTETDGKGNWFSFPTLFQNEDGTWVDMSISLDEPWGPVYQEALRRGEVIDFGTDKEAAIKFGKGSWKPKAQDGNKE